MKRKTYLVLMFLLIAFASACKGEPAPPPTTDPGQIETQVAGQVAAQLTEIALSQPTETMTSPPTEPEVETLSPTDTSAPVQPSSTLEPASPTPLPPEPSNTPAAATATSKPVPTNTPVTYACQVTKQTPENGKTFDPNKNFDVVWTVKNTGTVLWDENEVDYRYESGDELHQVDVYDLPKSVQPGESVDLIVEMDTPEEEDEYKSTWVLRQGSHLLCTMTLEIKVTK